MTRLHPVADAIATAAAIVVACLVSGAATAEQLTDLHDIAVGTPAQDLPVDGYRDFACAGHPIASWRDWASCPVGGGDGLRAVHVAYDQPGGETKVAGHPVDLTTFFDGSGRLTRIVITTDDHIAPYLHKKAYLLALQAKAHYGEEGWTCKSAAASGDEEPIGPVYVNESCTKVSTERRIEVSDRLFRRKGAGPRDFVSDATIAIGIVPASPK